MEISNDLVGKVCSIVVLCQRGERIFSARIIFKNLDYILVENSSGFRSTIRKDHLVSIDLCKSYYNNINNEYYYKNKMNSEQITNETL